MAERCQKLDRMMEDVIRNFGEALKIDEPYRLLKRDGSLTVTREDTKVLMEKMHEKTAEKFREKMRKLVEEQELEKRFEELENLETECAKMNRTEPALNCSDPKDDVNMHVLTAAMDSNNVTKEMIDQLKTDVEKSKDVLKTEKEVFEQLGKVIEKQQSFLKEENQENL